MEQLKILNRKEIKKILKLLRERFCCDFGFDSDFDFGMLKSSSGKLYLVTKEISKLNFKKLKISRTGIYFADYEEKFKNNKIRLSIEGAQLIGALAKKNILEIDESGLRKWFFGEDLIVKNASNVSDGFVILKYNNDFVGCGLLKQGILKNYVPKERRAKDLIL
ncbi:MAG: methyltransferase RsmF C-terminal domain-like protein [Candidatus Woesearchaeota archaeon]